MSDLFSRQKLELVEKVIQAHFVGTYTADSAMLLSVRVGLRKLTIRQLEAIDLILSLKEA